MSFLDTIVKAGKTAVGYLTGDSIGSKVAKAALLGLALNKVNKSVNKENSIASTPTRNEIRETLIPNTNNAIPVVYGSAFVKGIITDAFLQDQKFMFYCITICEKTGKLNLGDGTDSVFSFNEFYINTGKVTFRSDGITVASLTDANDNINNDVDGLIKIWCFNNGSLSPVAPKGFANVNLTAAYGIMPNWTSLHTMDELVFAIVRVQYNREKNVTSLGEIEFKIENSMTLPGDCVFDYMTNTRYGAGIPKEEIDLR
jgi:hypothetical protein